MHPTKILLSVLVSGLLTSAISAAEINGVIAKFDPEKKELLVEGRGKARGLTFRFALTDDTRVLFGSKPGAVADLLADKRIRVAFDEQDGKQLAVAIHCLYAQPKTKTEQKTGDGLTGSVKLINRTEREVVIAGSGNAETTLLLPENAKIDRAGKEITLDEVKEGEGAQAEAEQKDGKWVARALHLGGTSAPAPAKDDKAARREKVMKILETVFQELQRMRQNGGEP
jgi:hypothetical protein